MLPSATAANGDRTRLLNARERSRLLAGRTLDEAPYRKVPAVNPPGTRTPGASLTSAKAASAPNPPPSTHQPQSVDWGFSVLPPSSAVTPDNDPAGPSGPTRKSWADMSEQELPSQNAPIKANQRCCCPPSFPLFTRASFAAVHFERRAELVVSD